MQKQTVKAPKIKEIRLRPNIAQNDLDTKTNQIIKFLLKGNKVRIGVFFKGRENDNIQPGVDIINQIKEAIGDIGKPDSNPSKKGTSLSIVVSPTKKRGT